MACLLHIWEAQTWYGSKPWFGMVSNWASVREGVHILKKNPHHAFLCHTFFGTCPPEAMQSAASLNEKRSNKSFIICILCKITVEVGWKQWRAQLMLCPGVRSTLSAPSLSSHPLTCSLPHQAPFQSCTGARAGKLHNTRLLEKRTTSSLPSSRSRSMLPRAFALLRKMVGLQLVGRKQSQNSVSWRWAIGSLPVSGYLKTFLKAY